jgi:hypothetical protein
VPHNGLLRGKKGMRVGFGWRERSFELRTKLFLVDFSSRLYHSTTPIYIYELEKVKRIGTRKSKMFVAIVKRIGT